MGPIDVGGRFSIWFEVVDAFGTTIGTIDGATRSPVNRVIVKNKCALPKSIKIDVSLPSGSRHVEFNVNGGGSASWSQSTLPIASMGTATLECDMAYKAKAGNLGMNIQFDKLSCRPALGTKFIPESDPSVPFSFTIQVG